ncbi:MAG: prolipoprotein diacylglyceryl transferase [Deltaproteobacteria bacterium]|nr:prolipoprotein diacylglyceryl transferase [Deltaproteobacteria bacterium]
MSLLPKFTWDIDPVLLHYPDWITFLPGDGIRYYSLLYVGVFLGGYRLLDWQIRRGGGPEEDGADFVTYGVLGTLIGSRVGHVFLYEWDHFVEDPMFLLRIHKGGLASHGGTLGLLFVMWLFTRSRRQSFLEGCDRFSYSAGLGATLIRLGNWFNSEIVGRKTDQSWGVYFPRFDHRATEPVYRHPSQLYEFALGLLVLGTLYAWDRKLGEEKRPRGAMISMFFAVYFTGRFLVEYVKEFQAWAVGLPFTEGQIYSIIPAVAGYFGLWWSLRRNVPAHWYTDADDQAALAAATAARAATQDPTKRDSDVDAEFGG